MLEVKGQIRDSRFNGRTKGGMMLVATDLTHVNALCDDVGYIIMYCQKEHRVGLVLLLDNIDRALKTPYRQYGCNI